MKNSEENVPLISIVIPILNESGNLSGLVDALRNVFEELAVGWEVIFVDDGSVDDSWQQLQILSSENENLSIIRFTRNFGKEAAIHAGLVHSRAPFSLVMDSDMQHPPALIKQMWTTLHDSAVDVVSAVKTKRQAETVTRGAGARLFYWLFQRSTQIDLESSTDFKLISARVRNMYLSLPEKHKFFRGLTTWFGFPEKFVTFAPPERSLSGGSRWGTGGLVRYALRILVSFSFLPIRLLGWLGGGTLVFALILGVQTLYMKFTGQAVEGFTTVIIAILFVGAILMMGLSVIGTYMSETYQQVMKRPTFVIQEIRLHSEKAGSQNIR